MTANGVYCRGCGTLIHPQAPVCPQCGIPQQAVGTHSKLAAALLAFFLGAFGVHKFYLGQTGWGIAYLLLCWTFIPAVASFVEGILYLTMSDEAFALKYG